MTTGTKNAEGSLDAALGAVYGMLLTGTRPETLPEELADNRELEQVLCYLESLQRFVLAVANGDLSSTLGLRGTMAGSLKDLQASLRHLTWQTQMIAAGDFKQRVEFMGDFSEAFNTMVAKLDEMRTELKDRETELSAANEMLRREIAERQAFEQKLQEVNQELARQLEAVSERNRELDAYAHTVAHDLKNPLNLIYALGQVLSERGADECDVVTYGKRIVDTARDMNNIINELLLLAEVRQAVEIELEVLDMPILVRAALDRLSSLVRERGAEVIVPDDASAWPPAVGYAPWIVEVWTNYLSNAITYGGQPPRVRVGAAPADGGFVRFWVTDNGLGLSSDQQARLFVPFTRLTQVRAKGHGLGLSIVRRIADKLGGEVGVESAIGRGSTFYFTLPAP